MSRANYIAEGRTWSDMKQRCLNPKNKRYKDYGGRGITICEKWMTFAGFYEDMGDRPSEGHSLDRIDNNGNYCKENCKWATWDEQYNNRRTSKFLTFNEKRQTISQWAKELGINKCLIISRLQKGLSIEEVLTNPVIHNEILVTYNGETHNIGQWGRIFGIDEERLRARIRNGWSFDKAISTPVNKYTKKVPFYE